MPDRLFVLAPWLWRLAIRLVLRLRIDSRLRRALLSASLRWGWGAFNRRDWKPMFVRYAPDAEFSGPREASAEPQSRLLSRS
jgi:hypothetical protein